MNWQDAHRIAMIAAQHATVRLDADRTGGRVADPFAAAAAAGVLVLFRPLRSLSGVYVREENIAGIVVNASHPLRLQRYTLAHELGHHLLGHASVADDAFSFGGDIVGSGRVVRSRDDEMVAEAFAAWYLMPRKQVLAAIGRIGPNITAPFELYQLSLRLGASYEATARHLPNLRLAERSQLRDWLGSRPRRELLQQRARVAVAPMSNQRHDVWLLGPRDDGQQILTRPGDRLVLALPEDTAADLSWALDAPWTEPVSNDVVDSHAVDACVGATSGHQRARLITVDVPAPDGETSRARHTLTAVRSLTRGRAGVGARWSVTVNVQAPQLGIDETWYRRQAA
jgi:Zn-dependent peptidase ImmA (M78 family)